MVSTIRRTLLACLQVYKQWGNAGSNNGSVDVTFPISFTKAVYQIQLTYNNNSYENPTYEIKDTKSFSYWSKYGGDKLWLAIGAQQWGVVNSYRVTVTFPLAYTKLYCLNAYMTASSTSTIDLYSRNVTLKTFDIVASVPDDAYASFDMAFWLSLGI